MDSPATSGNIAVTEPSQRAHDSVGTRRSTWLLIVVALAHMLGRHAAGGNGFARARKDKRWADLFLLIICYAMAIVINAAFDVTLEGPMQGIWFWSLFGFGIGSVMVYRAQAADGTADGIGSSGG